jgi:hypothetical protein
MQRAERPEQGESIKRPPLAQQPTEDPPSPFMPPKDAAALLNVSPDHVIRAVRADVIPGFKFGDVYRVLRVFVEDVHAEIRTGKSIVIEDFAVAWRASAEAVAS